MKTYSGPAHRSMWARSTIHSQPARWPESSPCSSQGASLSACSPGSLCTYSWTHSNAAPAEQQHGGSSKFDKCRVNQKYERDQLSSSSVLHFIKLSFVHCAWLEQRRYKVLSEGSRWSTSTLDTCQHQNTSEY